MNQLIERSRRKQPAIYNEVNFILHFFYSAAFFYLKYLKFIYHSTSAANIKLEKSVRNEDLLHIMALQRSLVYFGTSLKGNQMVIHRIKSAYAENFDSFLLEDVEIELRQADNTVDIYSNILAGMLDTFASVISNNVNAVMKRMTGLSIILMVPTIVGSFYGMNVEITYGNHPWVFWVIVAGSFFLSSLAWLIFRRLKWI